MFLRYASVTGADGERFMTEVDFFVRFLKIFPEKGFDANSVRLLGGVLDGSKDK